MPKAKDGQTNTTVTVDDAFRKRLDDHAKKLGVGWTTALKILARERLDQIESGA